MKMMGKIIDAHIHLDNYDNKEIQLMMAGLEQARCTDLISVSYDLASCRKNLLLAEKYHEVKTAFGYHPEQGLPSDNDVEELLSWIDKNQNEMVAVGEVGLPYYLRRSKGNDAKFPLEGYIEVLDAFLKSAKEWDKPVVLHAVYDDAPIVCDLLEKYSIEKAHFHWFKGKGYQSTVDRMIENGYHISITPDVLYEEEIQQLVKSYPIDQMMVETDGPWRFDGEFSGKMTHPEMIHQSIPVIAALKENELSYVYNTLYENTRKFYALDHIEQRK